MPDFTTLPHAIFSPLSNGALPMLRIVDRYLLVQFVQIFLICYVSLTGLFVVIDAFGHIDHFMTYAHQHDQSLARVLAEYYSYRAIAVFDQTSGVLALVAAMFTVTWIERHNEMTALMAAGVSRFRVLRPVLVAALLLGVLAAANRETVIPQIRSHLAIDSKNLGGDRAEKVVSRYDSQTDILLDGDEAIASQMKIMGPNFVLPSRIAKYGKQLAAAEAQFVAAEGNRPSGYWLRGVTSPKRLKEKPSVAVDGHKIIVTPHDAPWLADDELFVVSEVAFELLTGGSVWREFASTAELVTELRSPSVDLGNDVRVAIHSRLLKPFLDGTLIFLGLPLIVSRNNRNPYVAIGLAIGVVTAFFIITLGCQSLGNSGWIRPTLAAWLPLIVFAPVAVYLTESLRK
ncbi:MAG: LptF/LptG family permease [Aeoliella sp.]